MHAKPLVVLDPDGTYAGLHALVDTLVGKAFVRPEARDAVQWARSVPEAFALLDQAWASGDLPPSRPPKRCSRRSRRPPLTVRPVQAVLVPEALRARSG